MYLQTQSTQRIRDEMTHINKMKVSSRVANYGNQPKYSIAEHGRRGNVNKMKVGCHLRATELLYYYKAHPEFTESHYCILPRPSECLLGAPNPFVIIFKLKRGESIGVSTTGRWKVLGAPAKKCEWEHELAPRKCDFPPRKA